MEMDPNKRLFSTRVFCGAVYGRALVANNRHFEWGCLRRGQLCRQQLLQRVVLPFPVVAASSPILFTLLIPLTIFFVGKDVIMNAYSEQMENVTLNFGMLKNDLAKNITKACVALHVSKRWLQF
jgi:hypothetical protein